MLSSLTTGGKQMFESQANLQREQQVLEKIKKRQTQELDKLIEQEEHEIEIAKLEEIKRQRLQEIEDRRI